MKTYQVNWIATKDGTTTTAKKTVRSDSIPEAVNLAREEFEAEGYILSYDESAVMAFEKRN